MICSSWDDFSSTSRFPNRILLVSCLTLSIFLLKEQSPGAKPIYLSHLGTLTGGQAALGRELRAGGV